MGPEYLHQQGFQGIDGAAQEKTLQKARIKKRRAAVFSGGNCSVQFPLFPPFLIDPVPPPPPQILPFTSLTCPGGDLKL